MLSHSWGDFEANHSRLAKKTPETLVSGVLAEMEGFEPPDGLTRQLISSQPRYDHFDTSPYSV